MSLHLDSPANGRDKLQEMKSTTCKKVVIQRPTTKSARVQSKGNTLNR